MILNLLIVIPKLAKPIIQSFCQIYIIIKSMQNDYDLPTDRSIQSEQILPPPSKVKPASLLCANQLIIDKMTSHLAFIECEFTRNMEWQRHLLKQIQEKDSRNQKKEKEVKDCHELRFGVNQQRMLRQVLASLLGNQEQGLDLQEMLVKAYKVVKNGSHPELIPCTFSPNAKEQQAFQFPVVERVLTLNDLAPSTQRHITATPSSLPPKTPKARQPKDKKGDKQNQCLILTPQEVDRNNDSEERVKKVKTEQRQHWGKARDVIMEDSLGKRLFQQDKEKFIYIEDRSQYEKTESQVSLNLSMSNEGKAQIASIRCLRPQQRNSIQHVLKSGSIQHESIMINIPSCSPETSPEPVKQSCEAIQGLHFKEYPRRKIGKCVYKKENYFSYQEGINGNVRKLHDSFGEAYQEYMIEGSNQGSKQSYFYQQQRRVRKY